MNVPVLTAGIVLTLGSVAGETAARSIGQNGIALLLELLFLPGFVLLAFGLIMARPTTEGEEIAAPTPLPPPRIASPESKETKSP
ncbi:MAG: hypothetical protein ACREDK_04420 [Thermoplasmata archaeon]